MHGRRPPAPLLREIGRIDGLGAHVAVDDPVQRAFSGGVLRLRGREIDRGAHTRREVAFSVKRLVFLLITLAVVQAVGSVGLAGRVE
jgi:hypothetical protein